MSIRKWKGLLVAAVLVFPALASAEQMMLEVIDLNYRSSEEIIAILDPLVPPPGSVRAMHNKLIIKTTPDNLEDIKRALARLDTAPRSLLITVTQGLADDVRNEQRAAFAGVKSDNVTLRGGQPVQKGPGLQASAKNRRTQAAARVYRNRSLTNDSSRQSLRAIEGQPAFIGVGKSVPFGQRSIILSGDLAQVQDTILYKDITTGFYVLPRLSGDRVLLDMWPHRSNLSREGGGRIDIQGALTTVSGHLGEWIHIGGANERASLYENASVYSTRSKDHTSYSIYVKVDELPY